MAEHSELVERIYDIINDDLSDRVKAFLALKHAAETIVSLRASLANAESRAEDAEARNVFLETEIVALAEKVKKS